METASIARKVTEGYGVWIQERQRAASKSIEYGDWWRLDSTYWRVTWLEATGELYAAERKPSDRYVVLCSLERREITTFMKNWFDGNELSALFQRFDVDWH